MRVWIFQIGQRYNRAVDDREIFANLLDEAALAEELGFEGLWAAEHHFTNYASVTNPLLYLAAVAQRTTTLRIGSMAVVLPLHHPVRAAEEIAMLDHLSAGRLEVGVARGYSRYEYGGLGLALDDSKQAMDYEMFLVSGMRESHAHGAEPAAAVVGGFRRGARVVTAAALIMTAVFSGFIFGDNAQIKSVGFALAFGVLAGVLVVRMAIVPAAMSILGRSAWWLPRWLARLLPNVDVEGQSLLDRRPGEVDDGVVSSV